MGLIFVPTYIKFMGIEAYGLVGFFANLLAMCAVLDMGLSATLNREVARRVHQSQQAQSLRNLLRTVEIIYWSIAVFIGIVVVLLSYPISEFWIRSNQLSPSDVQKAILIMGLVLVLRWPFGMYQGGLMGMQRQVLVNTVNSLMATVRGLGAVVVLWLVSPTIHSFFIWQIVVSGCETIIMALFLWNSLPPSDSRPKFTWSSISQIWRFAAGITGVYLTSVIYAQSDKIILSKLLSLENYGCYMLVWTLSASLYRICQPISAAIFPRFSQFFVEQKADNLVELYHKSSQLMSTLVFPISALMMILPTKILYLWTGDPDIVSKSALLLSFITVSITSGALWHVPYTVLLAYGWTTLILYMNLISIFVFIPLLFAFVHYYGLLGAGFIMAFWGMSYFLLGTISMHKKLLKGQLSSLLLRDIFVQCLITMVTVYAGSLVIPIAADRLTILGSICILSTVGFAASLLVSHEIRPVFYGLLLKLQSQLKSKVVEGS